MEGEIIDIEPEPPLEPELDVHEMIEGLPTLPAVQLEQNLEDRSEARQFIQALVKNKELDEEAYMPSEDEHLLKQTRAPLLAEIRRLTKDNQDLAEQLVDADPTTQMTPQMIRNAMKENTTLLLSIRKELQAAMPKPEAATQVGISVDVGNIFNEALQRAKEATIDVEVQEKGS
jgi:phage-related protein